MVVFILPLFHLIVNRETIDGNVNFKQPIYLITDFKTKKHHTITLFN